MAVTPEGNVAYLEQVLALAERGAPAVAEAMAEYIADRVANDTLTRNRNPPGNYNKARRGAPPSYGSGALANSIYSTPASGGLRASAMAGSTDKRARLFEFGGCVLQPARAPRLHWKDSGGWWSHPFLKVDSEHPFLGPTTEEAIDDGELHRVAVEEFRKFDP